MMASTEKIVSDRYAANRLCEWIESAMSRPLIGWRRPKGTPNVLAYGPDTKAHRRVLAARKRGYQ